MVNIKKLIGWLIGVAVFFFFCFVPVGLPKADGRIFGIILFTVVMWIFEPIPAYASALLVIPLFFAAGVPAQEVLSGFSDPTWVFVLSVFIFGAAIQESGIGKRLALLLLARISLSYGTLILGFLIVGSLLTLFIPSSVAKSAVMLPIALSIANEMGEEKNSPAAAGLTLSVMFGGWTTAGLLPTGAVANLILLGVIAKSLPQYNYYTTYEGWLILLGIVTVLTIFITWLILIQMFKPKDAVISPNIIKEEIKSLPPKLSDKEMRVLILVVAAILFWSTSAWIKIPAWVIGVFTAALLASPNIGILKAEDLKKLDWPTIIWMGGMLTIANLMSKYAIADWLAKLIIPLLQPFTGNVYLLGSVITIAFLLLSVVIVNPYILACVLLPPLVSLSPTLGINPMLFVALFLLLFRFFIFPYQCQPAIAVYGMAQGEGYTLAQLTKAAAAQAVFALPVALISVFYWSILGII